jgi:hypothetical protein
MKKKVEYQVSFDVESEIKFLEVTEEGAALFSIYRSFPDGVFDGEEDEAQAIWEDDKVIIEGYGSVPNEQEQEVITQMMKELQEKGSW